MNTINRFIKDNFESFTDSELAKQLNKANKGLKLTPNAVRLRRKEMGLKKKEPEVVVPVVDELQHDQSNLSQKKEQRTVKQKYEHSLDELDKTKKALSQALQLTDYTPRPFPITLKEGGQREATAVAKWSDWHSDEIVEPSKVSYLNEINPDIAKRRAARAAELLVRFIRTDRAESIINNLILWLGGDFFTSSEMHDAKVAFEPVVAAMYAEDLIVSGIKFILENEPNLKIQIVGSVGNHSRIAGSSQKVNQATEQERSLEWFIYHAIRKQFKGVENVNFVLENGYQTYIPVYGKNHRFNHGHLGWSYRDGLGGVHGPLWKVISQKWNNQIMAVHTDCGHLHTYTPSAPGRPYSVNGSLIGLSAYSMHFGFEEPIQAYHLIHSEYGIVNQRPMLVDTV